MQRDVELFEAYDFAEDEDTGETVLSPSAQKAPDELRTVAGKQKLLNEAVDRVTAEFDLDSLGLTVETKVGRRAKGMRVVKDGEDLWSAQDGIDSAVYRMAESLHDALPRPRHARRC